MSNVRQIFVRQLKLIALVGAPLLFVAGCSNAPTCAEGNTSEACRVRGGVEQTGSISPRDPYREATGSIARPVITRPATVYVQPYPQRVVYAPTQRQFEMARLRRAAACETTASIPRYRETTASIPRYSETTGSISPARYSTTTTALPVRSVWHVVARGETLSMIARRYQVSVVDIARYNELRNFPQIRSGSMILIPLT
jgi:hypothetical protein